MEFIDLGVGGNIVCVCVGGGQRAIQVGVYFTYSNSDVRGHGHAAGNVSTFFNSKSGNCLARRLSAVSVAKNRPKVFRYADSN